MQVQIVNAIIDLCPLADIDYQKASVFADIGIKNPVLMVAPLINQDIGGLIGAKLVIVYLLVVVQILEFLPRTGSRVPAIVESLVILGPRNARELDPFQFVRRVLGR